MNPLAESAAEYFRHNSALEAAVGKLDQHLHRCDTLLHPAPAVPAIGRATRRHLEKGLEQQQQNLRVPARALATVETTYTANANQF